jgi:hypothetical protein
MKTDHSHSRNSKRAITLRLIAGCVLVCCAVGGQPFSIRARGEGSTSSTDPVVVLDPSRALTATIPTTGDTVTATAADGTRFTLTIPAGALLSDEEITLTPVDSIENLPLSGGLVAAVQVEPEGLLLWTPAALTIEPPAPVAVSEEMAFAYRGQGTGFHLYPLQIDPSSITMRLVHFSGYGVGRGTDADAERIVPVLAQDTLEQDLQKVLREERLNQAENSAMSKGGNRQLCRKMSPVFLEYFAAIRDLMAEALASQDEAKLRCALSRTLRWERFTRIEEAVKTCLGRKLSGQYGEVRTFWIKALEMLAAIAHKRCMSEHTVEDAIRLIRLHKEALALATLDLDHPVTPGRGFTLLSEKIYRMMKECAKFELDFNSAIVFETGVTVHSYHIRAEVPLQLAFEVNGDVKLTGQADIGYVSYRIATSVPECSWVPRTEKGTFKVLDVQFDLNIRDSGDCSRAGSSPPVSSPESPIASITIDPGEPKDGWTLTCGDAPPIESPFCACGWRAHFHFGHEGEYRNGGYVIKGWKKGDGETVAIRPYEEISCGESCYEATTLTLVHKPH